MAQNYILHYVEHCCVNLGIFGILVFEQDVDPLHNQKSNKWRKSIEI